MNTPISPEGYIRRHRHVILFGMLVAFYVMTPILQELRERLHFAVMPVAEGIGFLGLLLAAVVSAGRGRKAMSVALLLGLPALVLWLVGAVFASDLFVVVSQLFLMSFLGYVIWVILSVIFASQRVTFNTVCASLCIYLLLGLVWALAYSVTDVLNPAAFAITVSGGKNPPELRVGHGNGLALYFSFVTMTTLGYGDIVPTSPISRMLASIEAITGQLYLAVLVARLVGMHIVHSMGQNQSGEQYPAEDGLVDE